MFGRNTKKLLDDANMQMSKLNATMEGFLEIQRQTSANQSLVPLKNEIVQLPSSPSTETLNNASKNVSPIQAAYALNLCSVSISQIVDYNDLNILEQEYDAILNNLNLENFPKDEALLKILKQILDTITFFRIQEGDKQFIERDYQQKMKNAIWSAVPNFGVIVASANPFVMLMSLASQVGMGYMNYRKQKAENTLEYEKEKWQLQRAAMEQFNGLRRELFDTAWRLADKYDFPDEYRLTENQIHQYNDILMDSDMYRRDERLASIENSFSAYPPYWYYRGRTSARIALDAGFGSDIYEKYSKAAICHFRKYLEINQNELLRTDIVASSCCLELAGLLSPVDDRDEILRLIDRAAKNSGTHNDIKQLCANGYLAMGEKALAEKFLRMLVVESYNPVANAQLLSSLYCLDAINSNSIDTRANYETLKRFIDERYLMKLPSEKALTEGEASAVALSLKDEFLLSQKNILKAKYRMVIDKLGEKYTIRLNRFYQHCGKQKEDDYYLDSWENKKQRKIDIQTYFVNPRHVHEYNSRVSSGSFQYDLISYLNEYVNALSLIYSFNNDFSSIDCAIDSRLDQIKSIDASLQDSVFSLSTLDVLQSNSFGTFTLAFREAFITNASNYVDSLGSLSELSEAEDELNKVCLLEDIPSTDQLFSAPSKENKQRQQHQIQLAATSSYINTEAERERIKNARALCENIDIRPTEKNIQFITGQKEINLYHERYQNSLKRFDSLNTAFRQKKIIAILSTSRTNFDSKDLFLTSDVLYKIVAHTFKKDEVLTCKYSDIDYESYTGALTYNSITLIEQKLVDTVKLHELISDLQRA